LIILEQLDQRAIGAVRFIDAATRLWIQDYLKVTAPEVKLIRNAHGAWVITHAPGFEQYVDAFTKPPVSPALGAIALTLTVEDPSGRYLARKLTVKLPRDPNPANANSVFDVVEAPLYPAPAGQVAPGAAIVRATVRAKVGGAGLGGALIIVARKSDNVVLARGLSDARGEALVTVPGVPVMTWNNSGGSVLAPETVVITTAYYDPALKPPPDPEALELKLNTLKKASAEMKLASRREQAQTLEIVL
jgi:hypothetical protein